MEHIEVAHSFNNVHIKSNLYTLNINNVIISTTVQWALIVYKSDSIGHFVT